MLQLIVHNIGPIRQIKASLNKFNVLIGPQSSGKSTVAKIVSFCFWLEKYVLLHRDAKDITREFVEQQLLEFHKLENYLNDGYLISFTGNAITFVYSEKECLVQLKNEFGECKVGKVAYIPAERNVVTLPNIPSLKMPENNTRNFIFDWLDIHQKFQKKNAIDILKLKLKYYYEESSQRDMIVLEDGKEIMLEEASSGLQSVIPLYVYMNYLTNWVYSHQEDISYNKEKQLENALVRELLTQLKARVDKRKTELFDIEEEEQYESFKRIIKEGRGLEGENEVLKKIYDIEENISRSHYSTIIIEEPELNLFPETQKDLVYDMLSMINNSRDRMLITTHSPYLLYALNNCMLGYLVQENIPDEDEELKAMSDSWVNPADVSVWEIKDGLFASYKQNPNYTIQDEKGLIRNNYFDRIMKNIMADFSSLMDYADED